MLTNKGMVPRHLVRLAYSAAAGDEWVARFSLGGRADSVLLQHTVRAALDGIVEHLASADAALERSAAEAVRLAELAHARHLTAERLRGELAVAMAQRDRAQASRRTADELTELAERFKARAEQRFQVAGDDEEPCEDECEETTCHTVAAVATWGRAATHLRVRADELRSGASS